MKHYGFLTALLLTAVALAQPQPGSPWPMSRHDAKNTGICPLAFAGPSFRIAAYPPDFYPLAIDSDATVYGSNSAWRLDGSIKWTSNACAQSITVAADGTVYAGCEGALVALRSDGTEKWRVPTADKYDVVWSSAINQDGSVYFATYGADGHLVKISPSGELLWSRLLPEPWYGPVVRIGPTGIVLIAHQLALLAYDSDGNLLWTRDDRFSASGGPAIGNDSTIYIPSYDQQLIALSLTGEEKWRTAIQGATKSPVIGPDGTIYVLGADAVGLSIKSYYLHAVDINGNELWAVPCYYPIGDLSMTPEGNIHISTEVYSPKGKFLPRSFAHTAMFTSDGVLIGQFAAQRETSFVRFGVYADLALLTTVGPDGSVYRLVYGQNYGDKFLLRFDGEGQERWRKFTPNLGRAVTVDGHGNVFACYSDHLQVFDQDGNPKKSLSGSFNKALPRADGSILLLFSGSILSVDEEFRVLWAYYDGYIVNLELRPGGTIFLNRYVAGDNSWSELIALASNGSKLWNQTFSRKKLNAFAHRADGTIAIAAVDLPGYQSTGSIYVLDSNGGLKWTSNGNAMSWVAWGVDGYLFAAGDLGMNAYAADGHIAWSLPDECLGLTVDRNNLAVVGILGGTLAFDNAGKLVAICTEAGGEMTPLPDGSIIASGNEMVYRFEFWPRAINGNLNLGNLAGPQPQFLSLDFRPPGEAAGLFQSCPIDAGGNYTAAAPARGLDVSYQTGSWLRRTAHDVNLEAGDQVVNVSLINGDANGDNVVGVADMNAIFVAFGWQGPGDLDRSGVIDLRDLNIVFSNYGVMGDD